MDGVRCSSRLIIHSDPILVITRCEQRLSLGRVCQPLVHRRVRKEWRMAAYAHVNLTNVLVVVYILCICGVESKRATV